MKKIELGASELGLLSRMLRKIEFFTPLTVGQLERVLPAVMLYSYEKGEIALISDEPRTASVAAAEPTMLFTLVADDFKFVLHENPAAAEEMKRIGARRKFASDHEAAS
ncbi:MAG: hypothetical protein Q8T11_03990 [Elusimicrobiota bacterium]|nr:hypothetical protein [Elusimicrobiota bacterium]